jgi:hypothetical protein
MSFDPLTDCSHSNSVSYLLRKAMEKQSLDLCAMRMFYLDESQRNEFYNIFHQKFEAGDSWDQPVLALAFRGLDA